MEFKKETTDIKLSTFAIQSCKNAQMNDWDDIRFFLAVARCGNVTAASKVLGVNHSTVSRRIQALENKHGVRLFERLATGYQMTTAATDIYQLALDLESTNQQVSRKLFAQDSRLQGEINLTMPHDILDYCLIEELAQFRQQYPEIKLNLSVAQGLKNLAAREADVAIRLTPSPPDYLIGNTIAKLQHGIYANTEIHSKKAPGIVGWKGQEGTPDWVKQYFPDADIVMEVDDLYSMYAAVKTGVGIARMPCYLPDIVKASSVKRLPITLPVSSWGVWVLTHVDLRQTARVKCCREFLIERLQALKPLFEGHNSSYFS